MYSELALYIVADILYILYAISLVKCRATAYYFRNNSVAALNYKIMGSNPF